jgi:hypothetical protein
LSIPAHTQLLGRDEISPKRRLATSFSIRFAGSANRRRIAKDDPATPSEHLDLDERNPRLASGRSRLAVLARDLLEPSASRALEVTMATTFFFRSGEIELPEEPARLRSHAALVRALLDEVERIAPAPIVSPGGSQAALFTALSDQLAEEVGRLGCRMLECAAAMTGMLSRPAAGQRGNG